MSQKNPENHIGFGGDQTTIVSLSDITVQDKYFRKFIDPQYNSTIIANNDTSKSTTKKDETIISKQQSPKQHQSVKRGPAEIAELPRKQKKPLISTEQMLEDYKRENLLLRMQIYGLSNDKGTLSQKQLDDIKEDIVFELTNHNKQLEEELKKRDKKEQMENELRMSRLRDVSCQTNLDSLNIKILLEDRLASKKLEQERLQQQYQQTTYRKQQQLPAHHPPQQQPEQQAPIFYPPNSHQQQYQNKLHYSRSHDNNLNIQPHQPQIMKQLHYPSVSIAKQATVINNKQMLPDEKVLLEQIIRVNGLMTASRDILKTKFETQQ